MTENQIRLRTIARFLRLDVQRVEDHIYLLLHDQPMPTLAREDTLKLALGGLKDIENWCSSIRDTVRKCQMEGTVPKL